MNKAIIIGRLVRDPEMRTTTSGVNSTTFTVAVSRNYTNPNGERDTDFLNCVAWRKQAENIAKYCNKGSQVAVEGRIQTRSYTANDNTKRYVTEVIADNVQFLTPKGGSQSQNVDSTYNDFQPSNNVPTMDLPEDPYADFGTNIELTDDLPF